MFLSEIPTIKIKKKKPEKNNVSKPQQQKTQLSVDDIETELSNLSLQEKSKRSGKITIKLIKAIDISKRHHEENRNALNHVKCACETALGPHLRKLKLWNNHQKNNSSSFQISTEGDVILILHVPSDIKGKNDVTKIEEMIRKETIATGLTDWVKGSSGWRFSSSFSSRQDQKSALVALNKLQDVFKTCVVLFKMDTLRYLYNKKEILRKSDDICDMNHDLRNLCEVLIASDKDPKEKPCTSSPGLLGISDAFRRLLHEKQHLRGSMTVEKRWGRIIKTVYDLMHSSQKCGPSSLLQWAAHPPRNRYCLTVITKESQEQVIVGIICIIRNLFWGKSDDSSLDVGGVGDVWYISEKRRKSDWEGRNDDHMKNFASPEELRSILNREY